MKYKDFSFTTYRILLEEILRKSYLITSYEEYIKNPTQSGKVIIMRHDVDRKPQNAVKMATIEKNLNIKASYYFRVVDESYDEAAIAEIIKLGHEIGYHYEDLALSNGDYEKAIKDFEIHLINFKRFYPVVTMCMHGSPRTKWDNKKIWEKYNYREFGISADPNFDIDFNKVFYITDASRGWNNEKASIRDKFETCFNIDVHSADDIINLFNSGSCPDKIMINVHPHNWAEDGLEWYKIKYYQGLKNIIKRIIVRYKKN